MHCYKRYVLGVLCCLFFALPLAQAEERGNRVHIASGNGPFDVLLLVADEKGFFEDHGVDVVFHSYKRAVHCIHQGLAKDNMDGAIVGTLNVAVEGFTFPDLYKIVTEVGFTDNQEKIIVRSDKGVRSPSDLKGKTIAVPKGGGAHFFLMSFLEKWNVPAENVTIAFMGKKEMPGAIKEGRVDAICQHDPVVDKVRKTLGGQTVEFAESTLTRKMVVLILNTSFIENHPEMVRPVLLGIRDGWEYLKKHPEEAGAILAGRKNLSPEAGRNFLGKNFNYRGLGLNQSLLSKLEQAALWAMASGLVDKNDVPDSLDLVDYSFLDAIDPGAVTIIR
ncbi:ABC transporter substrate-binding protein [Desulfoplanes sp.]